ncbi:MAG: AAA-associated domain-containing protein, partial [Hyphomicrobiales bacterium]|nr:AAA-associated domain-containing protein [Hyphomicrobiales bacterium]
IKLTALGKRFVDMDVDQRKKMIGEQVLANIPLASHIKRVLDERPSHRAPAIRFREELEDYMSEDYAERTLRTVINLGRYGELFAYDENAQTFSYENPQ